MENRRSSPQQSPTELAVGTAGAAVAQPSPRQAWIDTVKRRQELKYDRYCDARGSDFAVSREGAEEKRDLHWSFRPWRKQVHGSPGNTKDSCPFSRADSSPGSRSVQSPTPHNRRDRSPPPHLAGVGARPAATRSGEAPDHRSYTPAERTAEARRTDFRFLRERHSAGEDQQCSVPASLRSTASGSGGVSASGGATKPRAVQGVASPLQSARPTLLTAGAPQPPWRK